MKKLSKVLFGILLVVAIMTMMGCPNPVNPPANKTPTITTNLPSTESVQVGSSINFSIVANDPDGDTLTYAWKESSDNGTTWNSAGTDSNTYNFSKGSVGTWKVKVIVDDGNGGSVTSNICTVTVTTTPPSTFTVTLAALTGPFTAPASVTFNATTNYPDGTVGSVEIARGDTKVGDAVSTDGGINWTFTENGIPAGTYIITAWATNSDATKTVKSNEVTLTVDPAPITTYTVTFESNGGSAVDPITGVSSGSTITAPTAPTKAGFSFGGWYKESTFNTLWAFGSDTVTANTTLYAKWTANRSMIYKDGGDNKVYRLLSGTDTEVTDLDTGRSISMMGYDGTSLIYKNSGDNKVYRLLSGTDTEVTDLDTGRSISMMGYDGTSLIYKNSGDNKVYRLLSGTDTEVTDLDTGRSISMMGYY